jgi:hypothetical protein
MQPPQGIPRAYVSGSSPEPARPGTDGPPTGASGGRWYFLVTVLTAGFLAAVPFWHAASRLGRPAVRKLAVAYTAVNVFMFVLMALTPSPKPDGSSGNETISTIGGMTVMAVIVVGCLQLRSLRREVYAASPVIPASAEPAVARALAARRRREEARKMWQEDPALARELGIGRPDLRRGFDDGGLVDLNSAPTAVVAHAAGIEPMYAEAIGAARAARGGSYFNLGEVFVDVDLPPHVQTALTDRAVL